MFAISGKIKMTSPISIQNSNPLFYSNPNTTNKQKRFHTNLSSRLLLLYLNTGYLSHNKKNTITYYVTLIERKCLRFGTISFYFCFE